MSSPCNHAKRAPGVPKNTCRVCGHDLFGDPLLVFGNMPGSAQALPDSEALGADSGIDLEVCQCSGCGLVQLPSAPVAYYRDVIRAAGFSQEMSDFRRKQFGGFVQRFSLEGKKVLEVGCGRGEFLSLMKETGADAFGIENSEASVAQCLAKGLQVERGFIESGSQRLNHAPYDAFFILNFLEHLPEPNSTLRGIYNNLGDRGVGLVEVPNFEMIVRKKLFSEFITDHLLYFTKETLGMTLELNGFELIECREVWYEYILSATIMKRKKADLSALSENNTKIKREIEEYIRRFRPGRVAIWGAGHQSLTVISLAGLADKVKYVIDSATFKQGKYTPATHLPIVSPDVLDSDPVDAVIVMAASYSDEVARIVRQKFRSGIDISILRDYGLEIVRTSVSEGSK